MTEPLHLPVPPDETEVLAVLRDGALEIEGRLLDASNGTFYCTIGDLHTVYKPIAGERPLWDFPIGTLAYREVAAYLVSAATGWRIVPPTVLRDGPLGPGMCQLWIDVDLDVDLLALARSDDPQLRRMAVFDTVVNNADRKGGHLLPTPEGHIYGCDHGVCFSVEEKLRTLLWQWRNQQLTREAIGVLRRLERQLAGELGEVLHQLLSTAEVRATMRRVQRLLRSGRHPMPSGDWPAVPWPPF